MKKILAIIISNREKYFSVDKNCELVHGPFIFPFLFTRVRNRRGAGNKRRAWKICQKQ